MSRVKHYKKREPEPGGRGPKKISARANASISHADIAYSIAHAGSKKIFEEVFNRWRASRGSVMNVADIIYNNEAGYKSDRRSPKLLAEYILSKTFALNPIPDDKRRAITKLLNATVKEIRKSIKERRRVRKERNRKEAEAWRARLSAEKRAEVQRERRKQEREDRKLTSDIRDQWNRKA